MRDVKHPLRTAYYSLLNGALSYNSKNVPVGDETIGTGEDIYVILASQTGSDNSTFQTFDSTETINLDIVYKGATSVNKNVVDNVAGQILGLVLPTTNTIGLPSQPNIQITCVFLSADTYIGFALNNADSVVRRVLTFTQKVRQTS